MAIPERRQHTRVKRRLVVKFGETDLLADAHTVDLSPGGLFLVTSKAPPIQTRIHIQLFLEASKHVYLEGEVRRQRSVPAELRQDSQGGFGVRFLQPGEALREVFNTGPTQGA
jgi:hypothetical protein